MAALVLDASVALAWVLPGEDSDRRAERIMVRVIEEGALVPAIWRLEVGNVVIAAERRGRLPPGAGEHLLSPLAAMPITTDPHTGTHAWSATSVIARRHGLTLYDAAYLELARRHGLPLATFDAALHQAAAALGLNAGSVP